MTQILPKSIRNSSLMNTHNLTDNKNAINGPRNAINLTLSTGNALLQIYYPQAPTSKIITDLMRTLPMLPTSDVLSVMNHGQENLWAQWGRAPLAATQTET